MSRRPANVTAKDRRVASQEYRCSRCRFLQATREWNPFDPRIPVTPPRSLRKLELVTQCPDEGPDRCELIDPDAGLQRKWRTVIEYRGKGTRLCTPFIITRRDLGRRTAIGGPALTEVELHREFILQERIRTGDRPKTIDVADATRAFGFFPRIARMDNIWCLMPRRERPLDEWAAKVYEMGFADPKLEPLIRKIVGALNPSFSRGPSEERKAVLFVPIDLRDGIEAQLEGVAPHLRRVRDWLYRLLTDGGPTRPKSHSVWRDAYVYLLKTHRKRNVAQIGADVFREQFKLARERLVRQIIKRVQTALQRTDDDHLTPPVR